jgi:2-succinyl-6-hydroxy-2,4-cyclohexadiene-1-carboxylate synthase
VTGEYPALVLVHGFAQTSAAWDELRAELPAGIEVVAPTLPGHGEVADAQAKITVETTRRLLAEMIESVDGPVVLWGYSLGARVALDLLLERPGVAAAAIIESGAPGIVDPLARADRRSRDEALARRLENGTIEQFVELWEQLPALGTQSEELIARQRPMRLAQNPAALAVALRGLGQPAYEPGWDRLGEISIPVLLMTGEDDAVYHAHAERMAELLPNATRTVIPGVGHSAHLSRPDLAASAAIDFIAGF